MTQIRGKCDHR